MKHKIIILLLIISLLLALFTASVLAAKAQGKIVGYNIPSKMELNKEYKCWVKVQNTGKTTWPAYLGELRGWSGKYKPSGCLVAWNYKGCSSYVWNSKKLSPGSTTTYSFTLKPLKSMGIKQGNTYKLNFDLETSAGSVSNWGIKKSMMDSISANVKIV